MYRHFPSRTITLLAPVVAACLAGCAGPSAAATHASAAAHTAEVAKVSPTEANQRLSEGNARFVAGHSQHPRQDPERRTELASTQHPFAVVLGCADSRTGPETLFDQGLGDLFVVREAGNVVDDHTLGSIEYAVEHLHSPLIVVLGHERCGAVAAARDTLASKGQAEGLLIAGQRNILSGVTIVGSGDLPAIISTRVAAAIRGRDAGTTAYLPWIEP